MNYQRLVAAFVVLLVCPCAWAQNSSVQQPWAPHVFTVFGTFERVPEGWRCRHAGQPLPPLLRELQIGDVLTSIDSQNLAATTPIGMYQQLRLLEFQLSGTVEVERAGKRIRWEYPALPPQVIASQTSLEVLQSSMNGIRAGDTLQAIGAVPFRTMLDRLDNPLTSLLTVNMAAGRTLRFLRNGEEKAVTLDRAAAARLVQFDLNPAQEVPHNLVLHGLNTSDVSLGSLRGRWTLLHFWATWCVPCRRHLPEIRELAQRKDLAVAAIGFADTEERLSAAGAQENLKIFAPSTTLQQQLAITAIPFDLLLDPQGKAVLVVSGDMRNSFSEIVMQFMRR